MTQEELLQEAGIREELIQKVQEFRTKYGEVSEELKQRMPEPQYIYYGQEVFEEALSVILAGGNLLLAGPKATGKNVLAENLSFVFGRPLYNVSFHVNVDAGYLMGTDTYDGTRVIFREGPVTAAASHGGFCVLDEINMAKNEALSVLHAALDFRRQIDVPGYPVSKLHPATRFLGTMNYGYAGTRDLNEALTSRFAVVNMPNITEEHLGKLLERTFPDIQPDIEKQFRLLFFDLLKKAEHADISERAVDLRGLLDSLRLIQQGLNSGQALSLCITNKSFDAYERSLIDDVIAARIPKDLTREMVFSGKTV